MEKPIRSLMKAISWRVVATLTTILLAFIFTGNLVISVSIGSTELITKTIIYYVHERMWNLTSFGRTQDTR